MIERHIAYSADGRDMIGTYVVGDGGGKRPAVLVCHEGPGLDDHARGYARKLADLGYAAFALDYHGGGKPLTDRDAMMARFGELMGSPDRIVALGKAGLDQLLAQPEADASRSASIGFCFGGTMSFQLARAGIDIKAAVGFHAGLATTAPAKAGAVRAKVLALIGVDDPIIPPQQRADFEKEMTEAKADWQMMLYGGAAHSFTNPAAANLNMPGIVYDAKTEKRSWRAMLDLFQEVF
ncbi:MAG: dienelactone hydrolase family protein [Alphaproteobacteria bacterium]|nr:dienelactone hydrolase family protein [Alphaproteobacteria bacterium]